MTGRLIVAGPSGQMGRAVLELAHHADGLTLIGALADPNSKPGHMSVIPSGMAASSAAQQVPVLASLGEADAAEVLIDFTVPVAAASLARDCADAGVALVTGTTGLDEAQQADILMAAEKVPVVQTGNFSVGVNTLLALVEKASATLAGFDIEIIEAHHRRKVDAPSGTALMLGEAAAKGREATLDEVGVFERHGQVGPRKSDEIGFSVIRGGGVVGDHDVSFLDDSEVVTIGHRAIDRGLFAKGALRAAAWVVGKPPGLYSMKDVLGLS